MGCFRGGAKVGIRPYFFPLLFPLEGGLVGAGAFSLELMELDEDEEAGGLDDEEEESGGVGELEGEGAKEEGDEEASSATGRGDSVGTLSEGGC